MRWLVTGGRIQRVEHRLARPKVVVGSRLQTLWLAAITRIPQQVDRTLAFRVRLRYPSHAIAFTNSGTVNLIKRRYAPAPLRFRAIA